MSILDPSQNDPCIEQGRVARAVEAIGGPGNLGMHAGVLVGILVLFGSMWVADALMWEQALLYRVLGVAAAGYFGGGLGGLSARDEYLREGLSRRRWVVGLVTGALLGGIPGLLFLDPWTMFAGGAGGGMGGLLEAVVHRHRLEDLW